MNFVELQNEVIGTRFREAQRESIKKWINHRYTIVNAQAEWPWLSPQQTTITYTGSAYTLASDTQRILRVMDVDNENDLVYLPAPDFYALYTDPAEGGDAVHYTIESLSDDLTLTVGPLGGSALTLQLIGDIRPGLLVLDDAEPLWPEQWHFELVLGAVATGLKIENDPTWEALETEFLADVQMMKEELLPPNQPEPRQFGRQVYDLWQ